MTQEEMKARTKKFALRVIRLVESLPNTKTANVIGNQLLRSGAELRLGQTTGRLVGQNQLLILFQSQVLSKKKTTN